MHDARRLLADLTRIDRRAFWTQVLLTATLGWGGFLLAALSSWWPFILLGLVVATLAAFHATTFLHELSHLGPGQVPGLRAAWNVLWGAPLMLPSWTYERLHAEHHRAEKYGTPADPEYPPLARFTTSQLVGWCLTGLCLPFVLWLRFGLLTPLSFTWPPLRRVVLARLSTLTTDVTYRAAPLGRLATLALWSELLAMVAAWGWTWVAFAAPRVLACFAAVTLSTMLLQQLRTIISHRYRGDGTPMSLEAVMDDSFNFELESPLALLLWPSGTLYHALHHVAPAVPFHHLEAAHRRLSSQLPADSAYHRARSTSITQVLADLLRSSRRQSTREASTGTVWRRV